MGKRSSFERIERDFYPTPAEAVQPLLRFLKPGTRFVEPCAGNGALIDHLSDAGHVCIGASDIDPKRIDIARADALLVRMTASGFFITNPPWERGFLHKLIKHLSDQRETWLLFDADWAHTRQAIPLLPRLRTIVSVGRVKWIPDTKMTGKDNCAWHLFSAPHPSPTLFYGRT